MWEKHLKIEWSITSAEFKKNFVVRFINLLVFQFVVNCTNGSKHEHHCFIAAIYFADSNSLSKCWIKLKQIHVLKIEFALWFKLLCNSYNGGNIKIGWLHLLAFSIFAGSYVQNSVGLFLLDDMSSEIFSNRSASTFASIEILKNFLNSKCAHTKKKFKHPNI